MDEKNMELVSRFETIDFETGELVNVLDPSVPVRSRVDAAKWLTDRLKAEIGLCRERKRLWNERQNIIRMGIDRIREAIKEGMEGEGLRKIRTLENTVYLTEKIVPVFDERLAKPEQKLYDLKAGSLDYRTYVEVKELLESRGTKASVTEKTEAWLLPPEMVEHRRYNQITFRKSPKQGAD